MNPTRWMTSICTIFVLLSSANAYKVLMMLPFASKSHGIAFQPVAEELSRRGHNVTIAGSIKSVNTKPEIEHVQLKLVSEVMEAHNFNFFDGDLTDSRVREAFLAMIRDITVATYEEKFVQDLVKNPRELGGTGPRYDVVIVDTTFNDFTLPLAHHMGVPSIYFSPARAPPKALIAMNVPMPLSYVPLGMEIVSEPLNFAQRAKNLLLGAFFSIFRSRKFQSFSEQVIAKHLPNTPPLSVLEANISFLLINNKIPLMPSRPSMPYLAQIGGVHCKPAQKLPKELEDFMQSSGNHGVIYFSLGQFTKGASMPTEMRDKVLEVFSKLPQKILWKYEQEIENLPKNIKLIKWAPQQDILGHPKARLFITHGGGIGMQESTYHGCPMLAFPLSVDQFDNVGNSLRAGTAEYLDWKSFTANDLHDKITTMLHDKRYKENALKASAIFRDNLADPAATAAYWIEYVVRHRGAPHLKSDGENLNFFQYFLLDVIGTILIAVLIIIFVSVYLVKKCYRLLVGKKSAAVNTKLKVKKNA